MKRKITYLIAFIMFTLGIFQSCTETIDIELEEGYIRLAVEGYLAPDDGKNYVRLSQSAGYFSNVPASTISNANIEVSDGLNTFSLQEDATAPGIYLFPEEFITVKEQSYEMSINLAEEIGGYSNYNATAYMPRLIDKIDSVSVEFNTDFEFWMIKLYAYEPSGPDFYMFNAYRNDTLITDTISEVSTGNDELIDGTYMNGIIVMGFGEEELKPGDKFTLVLSNISEDYYNYIIELQTEISLSVPIFSGPPANVSSNVNNGAVGYFAAYPSVYKSTIVKSPPVD
jgi:hypothetical protein